MSSSAASATTDVATATGTLSPAEEKLLGFLAAGVSQTAAALACGFEDGFVGALLTRPDFAAALSLASTGRLVERISHDDSIESVEKRALKLLSDRLSFAKGPMEAAKIWQMLNGAKKHAAPDASRADALGAQMVTLVLPKAAAVQIQLNSANQVTDVNGRSMATLPSSALPALSAARSRELAAAKETKEIAETLQVKEVVAAKEVLEQVATPLKTMIGGVLRVL